MYIFKISLLLLTTVAFVQPRVALKVKHNWRTNRMSPKDNCVCYPKDVPNAFHKLLDPSNKGVERLVIYLYKTFDNNRIKLVVPSKQKQIKIPDVSNDVGEEFMTVTADFINSLFDRSPSKVKLHHDFSNGNNVDQEVPIGLHTGPVVEETSENSYNNILTNNYAYQQIKQYNEGDAHSNNDDEQDLFAQRPDADSISALPLNDEYNSDINANPNTGQSVFSPNLNNLQRGNSGYIKNPVGGDLSFSTWIDQQIKKFNQVRLPIEITSIDSNSLKYLLKNILDQYGMQINANGTITDAIGNLMSWANLELRPLFIGDSIAYKAALQKSYGSVEIPKDLPYLEGILVTLIYPPFMLGIIPLGKVLFAKSTNKPIVTSSARPKVKEYFSENTSSLDNLTPYQAGLSKKNPKVDEKLMNSAHASHTTSTLQSYPNLIYKFLHPSANIRFKVPGLDLNFRSNLSNNQRQITHLDEPKGKSFDDNIDMEPLFDANMTQESQTSRMLPLSLPMLDTILKLLLNVLISSNPNRRNLDSVDMNAIETPVHINLTQVPEKVNVTEAAKETDRQGEIEIKIIGGSAATSSGAPVANKGRSNYVNPN